MIARNLISAWLLPLKTSDTGRDALNRMDEYKVSHLPIVNNENFLGLISEQDITSFNNFEEPLGNHGLTLKTPFVYEHQYIFDVLKLAAEFKLTLIPVVDDHESFLGCITLQTMVGELARTLSVDSPGAYLVLEMSQNNYSLTEIANIVESNNARVLSTFLLTRSDSTLINVVLKLNTNEIGPLLQTFDRYDYFIKASFGNDENEEDLKERFDSFMNYLNI
ncbi:MAG: CBS domain-containing protein [Bacteroidales bacterium]|nr:CBS domain-containing protein [Bacteroidales bacterium]